MAIHILSNISRNKYNQAMKFGELIQCIMTKIFFGNSYPNFGEETSSTHFSEKLKLSISLDQP